MQGGFRCSGIKFTSHPALLKASKTSPQASTLQASRHEQGWKNLDPAHLTEVQKVPEGWEHCAHITTSPSAPAHLGSSAYGDRASPGPSDRFIPPCTGAIFHLVLKKMFLIIFLLKVGFMLYFQWNTSSLS